MKPPSVSLNWPPLFLAAVLPALTPEMRADVVISEFMASNTSTPIVDEEGSRQDWLELHNTGTEAASLNGWFLTDSASDLRKWRFPAGTPAVSLPPDGRLVIWCSGKNRTANAAALHTNFKLDRQGGYLGLVQPDGVTVSHSYAPAYPVQAVNGSYGIAGDTRLETLFGPPPGATAWTSTVRCRVPSTTAHLSDGWNSTGYTDTATPWYARTVGLASGVYGGIGFDTSSERTSLIHPSGDVRYLPGTTTNWMSSVRAGIQMRFPFTVADPAAVQSLQLKMRWEDGFTAWINGQKILEGNAPATLNVTSGATQDRQDGECEDFDLVTLPGAAAHLVPGANILAIHGLNDAAANGLFLCTPVLEALVTGGPAGGTGYLAAPTPGGPNTSASTAAGPVITGTTDDPAQPAGGTGSAPLTVTCRVQPTLLPVTAVRVYSVIMFGSETARTMTDDGTGGDAIAGDGIYSALIPTESLTPGQMLRWRIEATDSSGNRSLDPPYPDPAGSDRYFGTVAANADTLTSQLPVLQWFVSPADEAGTRTRSGSHCSVFFPVQKSDGSWQNNFYDNVAVNLHGQSSSGFPTLKKSHNLGFNRDNRFEWSNGKDRVKGVNLLTNYADKTHVRHSLAYETFARAGNPAHFAFTVRVQKNGTFWGLYDLIEDAHEQFLQRVGLDPDGALYKVYNSLENATQSFNNGNGVVKKTREYEGFADLGALVAGIADSRSLALRRTYLYDNVNTARLVNFLAVHSLISSRDMGHKNYYMYRDTNGTGEWFPLPWDQDLSFGHTWVSGPSYFDDDIDSQDKVEMGPSVNNRLMQLVYQTPELNAMFLRRLRTLMDGLLGATPETGWFDQRIPQLLDRMDPPGSTFLTDADLDLRKWGYWTDGSGTSLSAASADAATHDHGIRRQAARLLSSNPNPPYPSAATNANLVTPTRSTIPPFLPGRREKLAAAATTVSGQGIPASQPASVSLEITDLDFHPASGTQEEEYLILRNNSGVAVDISGWRLDGAIRYTFPGGTVIPAYTTGTNNVGLLHVAKNPRAFRLRTTGPRGGQNRLVTGPWQGQLSARGETVSLWRPDAAFGTPATWSLVLSSTWTPAPTAAQTDLRLTELHYHPAPPTPAELALAPGVEDEDFEFLELINNGSTPLALGGAVIQKGVDFTFPAGWTLAPGARCLVVAWLPAFQARYGHALDALIAGEYSGRLANSGEELEVLDPTGEVVLDFSWQDTWQPATDGTGPSLITLSPSADWSAYSTATTWATHSLTHGNPGGPDTAAGPSYSTWQAARFPAGDPAGDPTADPDGDQRPNFEEYAFGGDPHLPDTAPPVTSHGPGGLTVTFPANSGATDLTFTAEQSSDLTHWIPATSAPAPGGDAFTLTAPMTGGRLFFRLRAAMR